MNKETLMALIADDDLGLLKVETYTPDEIAFSNEIIRWMKSQDLI